MPLPEGKTPAERAEIKLWLKDRNKYPSGFCNEHGKPGQHEGQRPKDWRGRGMMVCSFYLDCPCACHYEVDKLFKLTGMERKLMENPDYHVEKGDWKMPLVADPVTGTVASDPDRVIDPDDPEHACTPAPVASTTPLVERRTPLGYAGRGTLEAQVWDACRWMVEYNIQATTLAVSEWIASKYKVPTPSRGAIQAVWVRWDKLNFGSLEKKPVHFSGFLNQGTWEELERLKGAAKQQKKSAEAAAKRGSLRPRA